MESDGETFEEEIDPRIKEELDTLNRSTDQINLVETQLTECREKYNTSLANATQQLQKIAKKHPKSIERARNYYETKQYLAQIELALKRAVSNFQRANGVYRAAKETMDLAESRLKEFEDQKVDMAWQEMLNLQMQRFIEADKDRRRSQDIHEKAAKKFEYLEKKLQTLKKKSKNSISKAEPYYKLRSLLESDLQAKKHKVDELQRMVDASKRTYRESLSNLEQISSEIHEKRRQSQTAAHILGGGELSEASVHNNPLNLNTVGPNTYDDLDELEADLDDFELSDDSDEDGPELSSTESESESEGDDMRKPSIKPRPLKRANTAPESRLKAALGNGRSLGKRHHVFKRNSSLEEKNRGAITESTDQKDKRGGVFLPTEKMASIEEDPENLFSEEDPEKNEATYTRLHGTNVQPEPIKLSSAKKPIRPPEDFDIFDELCDE